MIVHVHLWNRNTKEIHKVSIQPTDDALGDGWFNLVKDMIDTKEPLFETNRIYNLNDKWNSKLIADQLNECIDIVNEYDNLIDKKVTEKSNQEDMNYLHTFFENLRGKDESPPPWYNDSPDKVKKAVTDFNVLIHRYEQTLSGYQRIVVGYKNRVAREMTIEEKRLFKVDRNPGEVYAKYCHKGKDLMDIFKDQDTFIGDDNILPQHRLSSDFVMNFDNTLKPKNKKKFNLWLHKNKERLKSINIDVDSDEVTKGYGVVGNIIAPDGPQKLAKKIYGITDILKVYYTN